MRQKISFAVLASPRDRIIRTAKLNQFGKSDFLKKKSGNSAGVAGFSLARFPEEVLTDSSVRLLKLTEIDPCIPKPNLGIVSRFLFQPGRAFRKLSRAIW